MAQPTNTYDAYDSVGNREDLSDMIFNIAPTETPFMNGIKKGSCKALAPEWQIDDLASVGTNAKIAGDDISGGAITPTVMASNRTQTSEKAVTIAGSLEAIDKAGRKREMAYQMAKKSKELKRDMEHALIGVNNAKVTGNSTTAAELASVEAWLATNTSNGGSGAAPTGDGTDARTDGTQRAFTEAMLTSVLSSAYTQGGNPETLMVGAFNKGAISGFNGNASAVNSKNETLKVINSVDIYVGDFHTLKVVPNRFSRSRSAYALQMDMWSIDFLRPFHQIDLAKTGDSEKKALLVEYTLKSNNEKASGIIADLTTTV
jgi:hypothetical protein